MKSKYLTTGVNMGSIIADNRIIFYARGKGHFPLDMLRYDKCYPLKEGEARRLGNWVAETRAIRLETKGGYITRGRWKSFSWLITKAEVYNKNQDRVMEVLYFDPKTGELSSVE